MNSATRMKIVVAPVAFKGSLSAAEAAGAIAAGIRRVAPRSEVVICPMADGGEGTVEALVVSSKGRFSRAKVTGPLGEPVEATFGFIDEGRTAVIEMASASGLPLVAPERRNPLLTTTYGTGELIALALDAGVKKIIVGVGGSATVDGGVGMAQALGVRFLDARGGEVGRGGRELGRIASIEMSGLDARLKEVEIEVACDVDSPFTGPAGAARVYGPQKGATPEMVELLESGLEHLRRIIEREKGMDLNALKGAGAAGGLAGGFAAFLGAKLRAGTEIVLEATHLEEKMAGADLTFTGEGEVNEQTLRGKGPLAVIRTARPLNVPVIFLAGSLGKGWERLHEEGEIALFSILNSPMRLEDAMAKARGLLERSASEALRAFIAGRRVSENGF